VNNGGKTGLLSKVRQDFGKKKGIKRFYLLNSLSFTVARAGHDPATFPIFYQDAYVSVQREQCLRFDTVILI
jgi:hypothetical protein